MSIEIDDIIDNVGGYGMGTTVKFTYTDEHPPHDGVRPQHKLRYEVWVTDNSGGRDLYNSHTGEPWSLEQLPGQGDGWEVREELITDFLDAVIEIYEGKQVAVAKLLKKLTEETIHEADLLAEDEKWATL